MWVSTFKFSTYMFIKHYIILFCFVLLLFCICKEIVGIYLLKNSKFFFYKKPLENKSKKTAYECGFEPFNDSFAGLANLCGPPPPLPPPPQPPYHPQGGLLGMYICVYMYICIYMYIDLYISMYIHIYVFRYDIAL